MALMDDRRKKSDKTFAKCGGKWEKLANKEDKNFIFFQMLAFSSS